MTTQTEKKQFTFKDLKEAIEQLTPEQLELPVNIQIGDDEFLKRVGALVTMPDDIYVNKDDDEDGGTLEDLKLAHGDEFKEEDYELHIHKGFPFLVDDWGVSES